MAFTLRQPVPSYSINRSHRIIEDQNPETKSPNLKSQSIFDDSPPSTPLSHPPSRIASYLSMASLSLTQNTSSLASIFKNADLSPSNTQNNLTLSTETEPVRRVSNEVQGTETTISSLTFGSGVLFLLGYLMARTIGSLHNASEFLPPSSYLVYKSPLACGAGALILGILLPVVDHFTNTTVPRDINGTSWNNIIRFVAGLVAFSWAVNKLQWTSNLQVEITLGIMGLGLWFVFDRTLAGLSVGVIVAFVGALGFGSAFSQGYWIISLLFTSLICFGNIGRKILRAPRNSEIQYSRPSRSSQLN